MMENKVNWHLVLFADGSYDLRSAGKRLKKQAGEIGVFETITLENKKTLARNHNEFYSLNRRFMTMNRDGYGKWIWKPYLILSKLITVKDGDGVLYLDSGCYFNLKTEKAQNRLLEYFRMAQDNGSLAMQLYDFEFGSRDLSDLRHSKPFLPDFPPISDETFKSNQVQAGIVFFLKNKSNLELISEWYQLSLHYNQLLCDDSYVDRDDLSISDFKWDQSVFSLLYKNRGNFCLLDETYFYPDWQLGENYPIWAMRWKKGQDPFSFYISDIFIIVTSRSIAFATRAIASLRYRIILLLKIIGGK